MPIKKKNPTQIAYLKLALSRLRGIDTDLLCSGEPMLSTRLSALVKDLQISLENTEEKR